MIAPTKLVLIAGGLAVVGWLVAWEGQREVRSTAHGAEPRETEPESSEAARATPVQGRSSGSTAAHVPDAKRARAVPRRGPRSEELLAALIAQPDDDDEAVIVGGGAEPPFRDAPQRARAMQQDALAIVLGSSPRPGSDSTDDFEQRWSASPPDAARTQQMASYLRETALAAGLDPEVVGDTECKPGMCRVQLDFAHPGEAMTFQSAAQNPDFRYSFKLNGPVPAADDEAARTTAEQRVQIEVLLDEAGDEVDAQQAQSGDEPSIAP